MICSKETFLSTFTYYFDCNVLLAETVCPISDSFKSVVGADRKKERIFIIFSSLPGFENIYKILRDNIVILNYFALSSIYDPKKNPKMLNCFEIK